MKNMKEQYAKFAKTKIICHGARATRIGERLIRQVWKYLQSTEFVKGVISENERKEMFHSISLERVISYPDDIEIIDTGCDIVFQIILGEEKLEKIDLVHEICKGTPCITFVIGEQERDTQSPYISVDEGELLDVFLDLFSVYTFPQEYDADFEELKPLFKGKGKIQTRKEEGFNLCVMRKENRWQSLDKEIQALENEKGTYLLASRMAQENATKFYSKKA